METNTFFTLLKILRKTINGKLLTNVRCYAIRRQIVLNYEFKFKINTKPYSK